MTELHQRVLSEKKTFNGGTGFVVRAVQFEDTKALYFAISRQWLKADTKQWLPSKRRHVFSPTDVWTTPADNAEEINQEFALVLSNGLGGRGRDPERVNERDASDGLVQHDTGADSGSGAEVDVDEIVTNRNATLTASEPNRRENANRKAQTKSAYGGSVTRTAYSDGPSSSKRGFYEH